MARAQMNAYRKSWEGRQLVKSDSGEDNSSMGILKIGKTTNNILLLVNLMPMYHVLAQAR